jgi:hypothetical protein
MLKLWIFPSLAAAAAVLAVGCADSAPTAEKPKPSPSAPAPRAIGHGSAELNCDTFPFAGSGRSDWRRDSYSFGPFGVSKNFAAGGREPDGLFHSKTPMLVEGHRTVVVSVPESERDRVGIELLKPDRPISTLVLKPCPDKKRTIWAAGFVLRDLRPVVLQVRVGQRSGTVRVGPPETRR